MDFLVDLLLEVFGEGIWDFTIGNKRMKPVFKTTMIFFLGNILTVLFLLGAWNSFQENDGQGIMTAGIAVVWLLVLTVICVLGHKRKWMNKVKVRKGTCIMQRNQPKLNMLIRTATMADLNAVTQVEAECFPATEAATEAEFRERLRYYADHFWLMFDKDKLVSFVDGFVTDETDLTDEMYANASMHNPAGAWQMIFGVNTIPAYRNHGYAGQLIEQAILDAREQGRKGVVLTCKPGKVSYYARFGFVDEGISPNSTHGGVIWHQMRLTF